MAAQPMYQREELAGRGFGSHGVSIVEHFVIRLQDGTGISLKVFFPTSCQGQVDKWFDKAERKVYCVEEDKSLPAPSPDHPCPTVLEYLPYRHSDWTAARDNQRHTWLCSHGYVVVRADNRGTGSSEGVYHDEYAEQEQLDGCEIIDWISQQPWSNGAVGMYGKSWGGFNGLQMAFCQPKALKAVISLYSTDNRFTDDIHYEGGCVLANGMLYWASQMFLWNARPPHPGQVANWKSEWKKRLEESSQSWTSIWLKNQHYNSYWKHGSPCEDYSRMTIPILAIGGWVDGYTNAVYRMVHKIPSCRGIIGPWSHDWPDVSVPGPQIGFMTECLDFWDHHLKGKPSRKQELAPKMIWYQYRGEIPPCPQVQTYPGRWHQSPQAYPNKDLKYSLFESGTLSLDQEPQNRWVPLNFDSDVGLLSGEWLSFGANDGPGDQRWANSCSSTWKLAQPLGQELELFGLPRLSCNFKLVGPDNRGMVVARLCDVFPDGRVRLISRGVQNLALEGNGAKRDLELDHEYSLTIQLNSLGYTVLPGHSLTLSLSSSLWPSFWPSRSPTGVQIRKPTLSLPSLNHGTVSEGTGPLATKPMYGPKVDRTMHKEPSYSRSLVYSLSDPKRLVKLSIEDGDVTYPGSQVRMAEKQDHVYQITEGDPLSAKATMDFSTTMDFLGKDGEDQVQAKVFTREDMTADWDNYYLKQELRVELNGEEFFKKEWQEEIARES